MKALMEQTFGIKLEGFKEIKLSLPLYLKDGRRFFDAVIGGHRFVVVFYQGIDRFNINMLRQQSEIYREVVKCNVVLGFDRVSTYQRRSLIESDIPFISCNGQIYLPFMGVFFERCAYREHTVVERFMPATQLLFLLLLYVKGGCTKSAAALKIGINPMSVTRASRQLSDRGLIREEKIGTEVYMTIFSDNRDEVFDKAEKYLINPVRNEIFLHKGQVKLSLPAGEYGLSLRTELGYPEYEEYAMYKDASEIKDLAGIDPDLDTSRDIVRVQKWKYDPHLFSYKGMLDPVSLICTLKDINDERIHKCLEQVKGEIGKWQTTLR